MPYLTFLDVDSDLTRALTGSYDPALVALSVLIASLAAYAALGLAGRIRAAERVRARRAWLAAGAVAMGSGVWAMHFVGMLSFRLPLAVSYDVTITLLSAVPAVLASALVLLVIGHDALRSRQLVFAATLMGLGIGTMHYTGMAAMRMAASMRYDPFLFALSILVAVVLATLAIDINRRAGASTDHWTKLGAALVMGGAVAGMHYTGMAAVYFFPAASALAPDAAMDPRVLGILVTLTALLILVSVLFVVVLDRRLKAAARSLRHARGRLDEAIESISEGFSLYDADDRLELFNRKYREFFESDITDIYPGLTFEEIIRRAAERGLVPEAEGRVDAWIQERLAHHLHPRGPQLVQRNDGQWFQVNERRTNDAGTVAVYTDITHVKGMEQQLRVSQAQTARQALESTLLHQIVEAATESELYEEALQKVVDVVCELTGWPVGHALIIAEDRDDELIPTGLWHLDQADGYTDLQEITARVTFKRGEGLPGRILQTGEPEWISNVQEEPTSPRSACARELGVKSGFGFPIKPTNQWVVAVFEFFTTESHERDDELLKTMRNVGVQMSRVYERKSAEHNLKDAHRALREAHQELNQTLQQLRSTQAQLVESEKLASLGHLTAGIAHEINNPVGALNATTDVLLRCVDKMKQVLAADQDTNEGRGRELAKLLGIMEQNGRVVQTTNERITDLVSSLKNFTRLDEAEYKEADLHQGLDSTLTLLRHEIGPTIEVIKEYGAIPSIRCYPGELNQTFMALLRNAIHAIEESGIITLATACMDATITIKITDTGKGMTGEQRAALFDLDFTTRDDRVGIGMGLFSAYTTIQKHKGKIDIESEVGRGTVFTITLPRETP